MKKITTFLVLVMIVAGTAHAQDMSNNPFGKGLRIMAKDSSFYLKAHTRIQNRFDLEYANDDIDGTDDHMGQMRIRRARIKGDGYVFSPKVKYKFEYDVLNGTVIDAVAKWNFAGNFWIWMGQTKLPGNRERVISSQALQFVDRSQLNRKFTLDRDNGFQLRHSFKVGKMVVREIAAVSIGEGVNARTKTQGYSYTGRVELLPFGKFSGKGDYFASDLKREEKPKLAIGVTYDYNDDAAKSGGQMGSRLTESRDLDYFLADFMFKYKGLQVMGEYTSRYAKDGSAVVATDTLGQVTEAFYTGSALNLQLGYLLKSNWEFAGRYTTVTPEKITMNTDITEYTFGISKYVVGHNLKVQGDITLRQQPNTNDMVIFRLQSEVAF